MSNDLPPGWKSRLDPKYGKTYYYNKSTKQTSWKHPNKMDKKKKSQVRLSDQQGKGNGQSGKDKHKQGTEDRQKKKLSRTKSSEVQPQAGDPTNMSLNTGVSLPQGWMEVWSASHKRMYYYNQTMSKSVWTDPRKQRVPPQDVQGDDEDSSEDEAASSQIISPTSQFNKKFSRHNLFNPSDEQVAANSVVETQIDPAAFQNAVMAQFPALAEALADLKQGQAQLERERAEHNARMEKDWEDLQVKLAAMRPIQEQQVEEQVPRPTSERPRSIAPPVPKRSRPTKLSAELETYSKDLQRRSLSIVKRRSVLQHRELNNGEITPSALKRIQEQAERVLQEAASVDTHSVTSQDDDALVLFGGDTVEALAAEMKGVQSGILYAKQEMEAQRTARAEALEQSNSTYYSVLGVEEDASDNELKKGFRRQMMQWHPDKVRPEYKGVAQDKSVQISTAYECLSDPWEREIYDWFGLEEYLVHLKVLQIFKNHMTTGIDLVKHGRKGWPRKRCVLGLFVLMYFILLVFPRFTCLVS